MMTPDSLNMALAVGAQLEPVFDLEIASLKFLLEAYRRYLLGESAESHEWRTIPSSYLHCEHAFERWNLGTTRVARG